MPPVLIEVVFIVVVVFIEVIEIVHIVPNANTPNDELAAPNNCMDSRYMLDSAMKMIVLMMLFVMLIECVR